MSFRLLKIVKSTLEYSEKKSVSCVRNVKANNIIGCEAKSSGNVKVINLGQPCAV